MALPFNEMRPVYVVGIGLHAYQAPSAASYVTLGLTAVRESLADAGIGWGDVEAAYVATAIGPVASGGPMLRHLGSNPLSIQHVENASASGSSAFRMACIDVASGISDVAIAIGLDKPEMRADGPSRTGLLDLVGPAVSPMTHFAMLAERYLRAHGLPADVLAHVAVKNTRNASLNPFAQRREALSLEQVMAGGPLSGVLTKAQCCPVGEGAAAVIVASGEALERLGIGLERAVRVAGSVARSERLYAPELFSDAELTRETVAELLDGAKLAPGDLDLVEVHEAFTIEEVVYAEAIGLSAPGAAAADIAAGRFDIGGDCALSASGGLIGMGHPVGPTGVGQIAELTRQLRGEAAGRQHPNARRGLAHMLGLGGVCICHLLERPM